MDWLLLAGSLGAVLVLAAVARLLALGGGGRIGNVEEALRAAEGAIAGLAAARAFVSDDAAAALVIGERHECVLLKVHGVHVAARLLDRPIAVVLLADGVRIESGERLFGAVTLRLSREERDKLLAVV